jgi:hypothetical protein
MSRIFSALPLSSQWLFSSSLSLLENFLVHWADMPPSPRIAGGGILPPAHHCISSFVQYKQKERSYVDKD